MYDNASPLRPFDARMLNVGDGHWIYVEEVGTRGACPILFLHGGPGSGSQHYHRSLFDPARHHAILFDQRGAGRSHPFLSLDANTTDHLIADIERIREHFGIERWIVTGGSWGSTLGLAYAEAHPDRVAGLVLRAIFLGTRREVDWAFVDGPQIFRPDLYADWTSLLGAEEQSKPLQSYLARLESPDPAIKSAAARMWSAYERSLSELLPSSIRIALQSEREPSLPPTPIVEAHYIRNDFFFAPDQLLRNAKRLEGIPGALIQGRYDLLCPPVTAQAVADAWPGAKLMFIDKAGHAMTEPGVLDAMREAITTLAAAWPS